jgi:hypothetical protein
MAQPASDELLLRVRDKVVHTLDRLPRYMEPYPRHRILKEK